MLNVSVGLAVDQPGIVRERTVRVDDVFAIVLYVENSGEGEDVIEVDNIVLEVFFNDQPEAIVLVDPTDRPIVGEVATRFPNTLDGFSQRPVSGPTIMSMAGIQTATPLTLFGFASAEPAGDFKGRTGRAALTNKQNPFQFRRGDPVSMAVGKATAGLRANVPGRSTLIANGIAFRNGRTVPLQSIPSNLTITP